MPVFSTDYKVKQVLSGWTGLDADEIDNGASLCGTLKIKCRDVIVVLNDIGAYFGLEFDEPEAAGIKTVQDVIDKISRKRQY